jgi:lysyl-tRNA synthetase, class I
MTTLPSLAGLEGLAVQARSWPFEQAAAVVKRLERRAKSAPVVFETGYGPSGLPHIGTFGEVVRTTMVRNAFRALTGDAVPTRLIAFSDDMDGLRKVPSNLPNQEMLAQHLHKPVSDVPDPFGTHEGFAQHNNARLRSFLDGFGFDYEFASSTEHYRSGRFDEALLVMLERYQAVLDIMLPTLGPERRASYSPFLPISPKTGRVLQVPTLERNVVAGTIVFEDEDGTRTELPVTGGHVKVQWKPDWALRWFALDVDYEMCGKDLIDSFRLSSQICRALGGTPPEGFIYEHFLDGEGGKISKSKGNGIAVEEWLDYAPHEALALFNFVKPKAAKRLHWDVIPKTTDEYLQHLEAYAGQDGAAQLDNPVWHIHQGQVPGSGSPVSFALLVNLVSAANATYKDVVWGFIGVYAPGTTPDSHPLVDRMVDYAIAWHRDRLAPAKQFAVPDARDRAALLDLKALLDGYPADFRDGAAIQDEVYEIGKRHAYEPLRDWFRMLYQVLLGAEQGPRFGSFAALFGVRQTAALIAERLDQAEGGG